MKIKIVRKHLFCNSPIYVYLFITGATGLNKLCDHDFYKLGHILFQLIYYMKEGMLPCDNVSNRFEVTVATGKITTPIEVSLLL